MISVYIGFLPTIYAMYACGFMYLKIKGLTGLYGLRSLKVYCRGPMFLLCIAMLSYGVVVIPMFPFWGP